MSSKRKLRIITDLLMTISMPVLMAYSLIGETFHEWCGISLFILFILHHLLNIQWHKNIFRGKYNLIRMLNLVLDLLLFMIMIILFISGMVISKHVFSFMDLGKAVSLGRKAHILASNWGFILLSIHLGSHIKQVTSMQRSGKIVEKRKITSVILYVISILISLYGIYTFFSRGVGGYLLLMNQFVFLDFSKPLIFFFIDYSSIMFLFAFVGHIVQALILNIYRRSEIRKNGMI